MKIKYIQKFFTKYKKRVALTVLALFIGVVLILHFSKVITLPFLSDKEDPSSPMNDNGIDYGPPTEQEKDETDKFKGSLGNDQTSIDNQSATSQKKSVTPVVSSWGQNPQNKNIEISGYVPGIFEGGGTCTAILENSGRKVTRSVTAQKDAQSVTCGLISIPNAEVSPGVWTIVIEYSSQTANGLSNQSVSLEVK